MITINVVERPQVNRFTVGGMGITWAGVSQNVPPVLLSMSNPATPSTHRVETGWVRQDPKAWGDLRDRGVMHQGAQGTLTVDARSFVDHVEGDYPVAKTTGGVFQPYRSCCEWGESGNVNVTYDQLPTSAWLPNGTHVNRPVPSSGEQSWYYFGEGLVIANTLVSSPLYRDNGSVYTAESRMTTVQAYKRVGTSFRYLASTTVYSSYTASDAQAFWEAKAALGGSLQTSKAYVSAVWTPTDGIVTTIANRVRSLGQWYVPFLGQPPVDFGELAKDCAAQLDYVDTSVISLVFDVNDWRDFHGMWKRLANSSGWRKALKAYRDIGRGVGRWADIKKLFDPASSLFLFGKYGVLPSSADVGRLSKGYEEFILKDHRRRLHSRKVVSLSVPDATFARYTAVLTVETSKYPDGILGAIQESIGSAKRWGVYPNLTALADLVKYSFVLEWVLHFGDTLDDVDTYLNVKNYFPVKYCIASDKWEAGYSSTLMMPDIPVTGDVVVTYYTRWIMAEVPLPAVDPLWFGSDDDVLQKHGVEAGALLLQRM